MVAEMEGLGQGCHQVGDLSYQQIFGLETHPPTVSSIRREISNTRPLVSIIFTDKWIFEIF